MTRLAALLALLLLTVRPAGAVGFQCATAPDPDDQAIAVAIWYPKDAVASQDPEPLPQTVAHDAPVAGTHLPLIILSHGTGGGPLNYYDTAIALARAGFIVAGAAMPRSIPGGSACSAIPPVEPRRIWRSAAGSIQSGFQRDVVAFFRRWLES